MKTGLMKKRCAQKNFGGYDSVTNIEQAKIACGTPSDWGVVYE